MFNSMLTHIDDSIIRRTARHMVSSFVLHSERHTCGWHSNCPVGTHLSVYLAVPVYIDTVYVFMYQVTTE